MATRTIDLVEGEFYHVYNRGTEKRTIFLDHADHERFIHLLYVSNTPDWINVRDIRKTHASVYEYERKKNLVAIGAYCLMPNHFHILLTPLVEGGASQFMNKIGTSYASYFNKRYERAGSLFQGTFRSKWVDTDEYLKYMYAYIHLNPVKLIQPKWKEGIRDLDKVKSFLAQYKYSSLPDHMEIFREENKILQTEKFPGYFTGRKEVDEELLSWLTYADLIPG